MGLWTLEAARVIVGDVRHHTAELMEALGPRLAEREQLPVGSERERLLESEIQAALSRWSRAVEALGARPEGVGRVAFDNGRGYFAWRWPEERLEYVCAEGEDFEQRMRIQ